MKAPVAVHPQGEGKAFESRLSLPLWTTVVAYGLSAGTYRPKGRRYKNHDQRRATLEVSFRLVGPIEPSLIGVCPGRIVLRSVRVPVAEPRRLTLY